MAATVFLDTPLDGESELECEQVKIAGDIAWATSAEDDGERVIPLSNVTGVRGDEVDQEIEEIEFPGGRVTELVTDVH